MSIRVFSCLAMLLNICQYMYCQNNDLVYVNNKGIICWKSNDQEVGLFGANYSLSSACDYRAAGLVTTDRKRIVDEDMAHFARMGWDGMRICFWGDWENCDKEGNLIRNDHLDLMDYIIYKAKQRNIYILFTPITTYSSLWPDAMADTASVHGFSKYYSKAELGTNPQAIAAQVNYLKQILDHVNPYTGTAIKDEPNILFIEMINEPLQHSDDFKGTVNYTNTLIDAIRSTGCQKLLFYNVSQDMKIAPAVSASKIDGITFAMYPAGLNSGHTLRGNLLRTVDDYPVMRDTNIAGLPRIVYEFDEADSHTPYMYPAMVRTFRSVGAQFATMFSYDMLATAPYNLGWQTHVMNMVYYPQKAIGGIIAAEIMHTLPLYGTYGPYPQNTSFGPFHVSYEKDLSEMNTDDKFIYANNTSSQPKNINELKKIVGFASSPVVHYTGQGIYFLDKVGKSAWRLEVYPDAKIVSDPFARSDTDKIVSRLVYHKWQMSVFLPHLGNDFYVIPLNANNSFATHALAGTFSIVPGVYILTPDKAFDKKTLPLKIGQVEMTEFVCPKAMDLPPDVVLKTHSEYVIGKPVTIAAEVIPNDAGEVSLNIVNSLDTSQTYDMIMNYDSRYLYSVTIPAGKLPGGSYRFSIKVKSKNSITRFPKVSERNGANKSSDINNVWKFDIVDPQTPLVLFDPQKDIHHLAFTRIGDNIRWGIYDTLPAQENGETVFRLYFPLTYDTLLEDYTTSLTILDRIKNRGQQINLAKGLRFTVCSRTNGQEAYITLIEADGTAWSKKITLKKDWKTFFIPLDKLEVSKGVKLPLGFPERWNYWLTPAAGRGGIGDHIQPDKLEKLQISLRSGTRNDSGTNPWIEVKSVQMVFE